MRRIAIVNVNLEYELPNEINDDDVKDFLAEVPLPDNYVSDSFEFVTIVEEE